MCELVSRKEVSMREPEVANASTWSRWGRSIARVSAYGDGINIQR